MMAMATGFSMIARKAGVTLAWMVCAPLHQSAALAQTPMRGEVLSHPVANASAVNLRCEYLANPLGIDTPKPRLSWQIESSSRDEAQRSARILVASSMALLDANRGDMWDATLESDQSVHVEYAGVPLSSARHYYWKVKVTTRHAVGEWSRPAMFATGMLDAAGWSGADWIGMASAGDHDCPWVRKSFTLGAVPEAALACIGSIGYHELYVNGIKVSDAVLTPSESNLRKRALYVTYDIGKYLQAGENAIALWLAPGWSLFAGVNPVMDYQLQKKPLCIGKVVFSTGDPLLTDPTWKCSPSTTIHLGAWTNSNFGGDRIDARNHVAGWNSTGFRDDAWENATVYPVDRALSSDLVPPNRMVETIKAASITNIGPNKYRVKMDRLFTGWIEVALRNGAAGSKVTLTASSYSGAEVECAQLDEYVHDAGGRGVFRNRFSYHEIRYIVISGIPYAPALEDIKGYRVGNDLNRVGSFDCSNALLKRIYDINLNTFVNLTTGGVTVDCPHRERLGYGEANQGYMETCLNNYEMGAFYTNFAQNWRDVQEPDGYIPHTAPTIDGGGGPAWSGAVIAVPWEVYLTYGDQHILADTYPQMKRWIAFLDSKDDANSLLQRYGKISMGFLGDWLTPHGSEESHTDEALLFNNCYYLYVMRIMARIARVLDHPEDEARYQAKAQAVAGAINNRFFKAGENCYLDTRQTHLLMPLLAEAVPSAAVKGVMANLENAIVVARRGHLDVGDPGIYYLTKYLTETGRSDLVFSYANQKTYPGYGYFIGKGLDTWPEDWQGVEYAAAKESITGLEAWPEDWQWSPGSSILHSCYPGIGAWFQEGLGGIRLDPAAPGFQHFMLKPAVVGDVTWVKASVPSVNGTITSNWSIRAGVFDYLVTVPANSRAEVHLPNVGLEGAAVYEGATCLWQGRVSRGSVAGVTLKSTANGCPVWEIGSGTYHFTVSGVMKDAGPTDRK